MDLRREIKLPGPQSAALAKRLQQHEQRNVTFIADDSPVFWDSAEGSTVVDVDGRRYIDCSAAFGVANVGHSNPQVMRAVAEQALRLAHGMGDVHPTEIRVRLFERLATLLPRDLTKMFLATTGSEAVEAALKSAMLATGQPRFAACRGGYHGLSFGALGVSGIERFRSPFGGALAGDPLLLDYPRDPSQLDGALSQARKALRTRHDIAALVIEPIQGRAGCIIPPRGYLQAIRELCDDSQIVLIVDEIFTGFGRTGRWFRIEEEDIVPDVLCIGKAMGSGIPVSAAIGRASTMDAWPPSTGEALHTSTYLGNPIACAAALATIEEMQRHDLPARAAQLGAKVAPRLEAVRTLPNVVDVRGCALLWAIEFQSSRIAGEVVRRALRRGAIFLQSGVQGEAVTISPPLVITHPELIHAIDILETAIREAGPP